MSLFQSHFYHGMVRRFTVAIGTLFSDMQVVRYNEDGTEHQRVTIPITYSNKEKFVQRLLMDPDHTKQEAITLPRFAFELTSLNYDGQRKLPKLQKYHFPKSAGENGSVYTPVPYDLVYTLYAVTKTQDEMLQIIEQIMPAFTPDFTISLVGLTEPESTFDFPVTMLDIVPSDSADGAFESRRQIMWSMTFLVKGIFFGPVSKRKIILYPEGTLHGWEELNQE